MGFLYKFLTCLILLFFVIDSNGQVFNSMSKEDVLSELEKRDLDLKKVEVALFDAGIDLNAINPESISIEESYIIQRVIRDLSIAKDVQKKIALSNTNKLNGIGSHNQTIRTDSINPKEPDSLQYPEATAGNQMITKKRDDYKEEIWGQALFRENTILVKNSGSQLKAPESYVLGPGDELVISLWGSSQVDKSHTIDEKGYIKLLDNRIRVFLKGLDVATARRKVKTILQKDYNFSEGEFDFAVNYSRTVRISIYGEVIGNPGSYAISGYNSAFNALAVVEGPSSFGSLRNIILQKEGKKPLIMDIYKFMKDPSIQSKYFLDEGDVIVVPVQEKVVSIIGAVKRPLKYELLDSEGLFDLLDYSGGFSQNAFKKKIQIKRYSDDDQKIIDLNWNELKNSGNNFALLDGDIVIIEKIETEARNFVEAIGEIDKPAIYERIEGMRVSDLLQKVGINSRTSRGVIYVTRTRVDGTVELLKLNLGLILSDFQSDQNILLENLDKIEFWSNERYADEATFTVSGSVREEGDYPYDESQQMRVLDAILIAGGLRRDASNYATIHKNDPLNKKRKYYKTIDNLQDLIADPNQGNNFFLSPFDSLVVESRNDFEEELFVRIEGAVNNPGKFQYGENMTIKDLLVMSKGFLMAASTNNIEVSRVIRQNNKPTSIVVALLEIDKEFNVLTKGVANGEYPLEPFDNVAVRYIKDFELQKRVFLKGEVAVPGPYAIFKDNLQISDVIKKAGGLAPKAYPAGATLYREVDGIGNIVIKLDEIISNEASEFNFVVRNGDVITIPTVNEFVTIRGATRVKEVLGSNNISGNNEIKVPYQSGKDAWFYINEHAGGLADEADKSKIFVEHANGEIKRPTNGFLRKKYPKVLQGSTISVGYKTVEQKEEESDSQVDWGKVLGDSVAQAVSILSLLLLIQKVD